jgi:hypothetical protein
VEQADYQSRRACGFFLARLVDARQPVFIGKRDPKCPRKHALAYTAFTPQRLYLSATSSPPSGFYAYVVIGGWVLQASFHRLEARNIPMCPTARPRLLESMQYQCYTSLASRNLPLVLHQEGTSDPTAQDEPERSRRRPRQVAPRPVAPLPREDEVEPSHKRAFCFQRGHTKPSPC